MCIRDRLGPFPAEDVLDTIELLCCLFNNTGSNIQLSWTDRSKIWHSGLSTNPAGNSWLKCTWSSCSWPCTGTAAKEPEPACLPEIVSSTEATSLLSGATESAATLSLDSEDEDEWNEKSSKRFFGWVVVEVEEAILSGDGNYVEHGKGCLLYTSRCV